MESVSAGVAAPAKSAVRTPEQLAKMLAQGLTMSSKLLVIVLLDLEERYIMTAKEAKDIADPAARMLSRVKALRKPIKWITGNSDEFALIVALGRYLMRLVDPVSVKIDAARTAHAMRAQLRSSNSGVRVPNSPPIPANHPGDTGGGSKPTGPNTGPLPAPGGNSVEYAGFAPEPIEAGAYIIPGLGFGFRE